MAIVDNFGITILTDDPALSASRTTSESRWTKLQEYQPPGSDVHDSSYSTCRRYIGVPPVRYLDGTDHFSHEFVIDYKVKCGFVFPDQQDTGTDHIVFRTYLDDEKIGSAAVKRQRWERSGTYRVRKQGKRYRVENEQRWIRQKWLFDPGLHGTIRVEVWRERNKPTVMHDWGLIDLTRDDDFVIPQADVWEISHEPCVKQPRVKHTEKVDLLPIATFEFEYRSTETLQQLGLKEAETGASDNEVPVEEDLAIENNGLWRSLTNTSSSAYTIDTMTDIFSSDFDPHVGNSEILQDAGLHQNATKRTSSFTDAIGRSLLTGTTVQDSQITANLFWVNPLAEKSRPDKYADEVPETQHKWPSDRNASLTLWNPMIQGGVEMVDLTMLD